MASSWSPLPSQRTLRTSTSLANIGLSSGSGPSGSRGSHRRIESSKHRRKGSESSLAAAYMKSSITAPPSASSHSQPTAEKLNDAVGTSSLSVWAKFASGSGGHGIGSQNDSGMGIASGSTSKKVKRRSYFDYYPERGSPRARDGSGASGGVDSANASQSSSSTNLATNSSGVPEETRERLSTPSPFDEALDSSSNTITRSGREAFKELVVEEERTIAFPPMPTSSKRPLREPPGNTSPSARARKTKNSYSSHSSSSRRTYHTTHTSHSLSPHDHLHDDVPGLRFSYSSSTQTQAETPPQTPIDRFSTSIDVGIDDIHVVVAAPISGVEAMDAMVDGMDGSDDDDLYKKLSFLSNSGMGKKAPTKGSKSVPQVPVHHPLYAPPLPTPPPGVKLGGALPRSSTSSFDGDDDESFLESSGDARRLKQRQGKRAVNGRNSRRLSITSTDTSLASHEGEDLTPTAVNPTIDEIIRKHTSTTDEDSSSKAIPPSISEIIRKNTGASSEPSSRPGSSLGRGPSSSMGHSTAREHETINETDSENVGKDDEADMMARSSMDSIQAEVQESLRMLKTKDSTLTERPPLKAIGSSSSNTTSSGQRQDYGTVRESYDPSRRFSFRVPGTRSVGTGGCGSSIRSGSSGIPPSPFSDPEFSRLSIPSRKGQDGQKEAIATYLRSTRITTLLKLNRRPHASPENPLTVSVSDLGNPNGIPLVVFLGLGCVRYVMGLYDEMAECLGLRLITIDRWGVGRTDTPHPTATRGVAEWATVVEEVLDRLKVDCCSVMAHSAGAPYALSFANKYPDRIVGDVCLLAPWVGGGGGNGGYRWLKYVPNGLLKTAQAAEWKIQAWMIGKPPKITYEGIAYNHRAPLSSADFKKLEATGDQDRFGALLRAHSDSLSGEEDEGDALSSLASTTAGRKKRTPYKYSKAAPPSSATFSDYDDLEDFAGRFESKSTLAQQRRDVSFTEPLQELPNGRTDTKKKPSRGFLRMWRKENNADNAKVSSVNALQDQQRPKSGSVAGKKLRTLKSIGSLRTKPGSPQAGKDRPKTSSINEKSPVLPEHTFDTSLGLDDVAHVSRGSPSPLPEVRIDARRVSANFPLEGNSSSPTLNGGFGRRAGGRRSISFTATTGSYTVVPSPPPSAYPGGSRLLNPTKKPQESYQVALGNALIAASHAESSKGTHTDLLQILNHEQKPWGFSYSRYPHQVRVWYGDKDERIAENAVRWMEANMGSDRCTVKVVKGADHGLMYRTNVVVEVLEQVRGFWQDSDMRDGEPAASSTFQVKKWTDGSSVYLYADDR